MDVVRKALAPDVTLVQESVKMMAPLPDNQRSGAARRVLPHCVRHDRLRAGRVEAPTVRFEGDDALDGRNTGHGGPAATPRPPVVGVHVSRTPTTCERNTAASRPPIRNRRPLPAQRRACRPVRHRASPHLGPPAHRPERRPPRRTAQSERLLLQRRTVPEPFAWGCFKHP
jgi:hypothetical protein